MKTSSSSTKVARITTSLTTEKLQPAILVNLSASSQVFLPVNQRNSNSFSKTTSSRILIKFLNVLLLKEQRYQLRSSKPLKRLPWLREKPRMVLQMSQRRLVAFLWTLGLVRLKVTRRVNQEQAQMRQTWQNYRRKWTN